MRKVFFLALCLFIFNLLSFGNEIKTSKSFSFASSTGIKFYKNNRSSENSKINPKKEEKENKFLYSMFSKTDDPDIIKSKNFFLSGWYTGSLAPAGILFVSSIALFFQQPFMLLGIGLGCGLAAAGLGAIPFGGPILVSILFISVGSAGIAFGVPGFTTPLLACGLLQAISVILEFYGLYIWLKKKNSLMRKVSFDIAPVFSDRKSSVYMGLRIKM
ncbi:MAG TPA: hypothetical protein PLO89_05660 [Spirochaetota bacterium]|nr:hypothetical protein [Spirochaetota bacterium]